MEIEAGKYYRTRDGRKVGPIHRVGGGKGHYYWHDGASFLGQFTNNWSRKGYSSSDPSLDIISEWKDDKMKSPVKTVTRKEIVPGTFGRAAVTTQTIDSKTHVLLSLTRKPSNNPTEYVALNSDELREIGIIVNQLAEALDENENKG